MNLNRCFEKLDNKKVSFKIEKIQRDDTGKYELILNNSKGEIQIQIEIEVLDKPAIPEGSLKVYDVTDKSVSLTWQPPLDDGGSPIESYIIERKHIEEQKWTAVMKFFFQIKLVLIITLKILSKVNTVSGSINYLKDTNLNAYNQYKFRVRAVNSEGEGPNLKTPEAILIKNPFDEPSPPGTPQIIDWSSVSSSLKLIQFLKLIEYFKTRIISK